MINKVVGYGILAVIGFMIGVWVAYPNAKYPMGAPCIFSVLLPLGVGLVAKGERT